MNATTAPGPDPEQQYRAPGRAPRAIGWAIFASRWLQAPLYLGLIVAQLFYVLVFIVDLWHLGENVILGFVTAQEPISESEIMLAVLGLIDVVMIANLLIMVIMGGYEIFVSRLHVNGHPDEPDWLAHVNANLLKVKLAISIISISSIHLLATFIEIGSLGSGSARTDHGDPYTVEGVMWQVIIHLAFIASALALAWIDKMSRDAPPSNSKRRKRVDTPEEGARRTVDDGDPASLR